MKLAIVGGNSQFCLIVKEIIGKGLPNFEVHSFDNKNAFLCSYYKFEITLLDIDIQEIDEMETLEKIDYKSDIVIFVSSEKSRCFEAFGLSIFAFIPKNELNDKLVNTLKVATSNLNRKKVLFKTDRGMLEIKSDDIYFVRRENRKLYLYTKNNNYIVYQKILKEIYEMLCDNFFYTDQSCLVNSNHIRLIKNNQIELTDGSILRISRGKNKEFKQRYLK